MTSTLAEKNGLKLYVAILSAILAAAASTRVKADDRPATPAPYRVVGRDRKRLPVAQSPLLESLKKTTVDEKAAHSILDQVFRPGDGTGPAQERNSHGLSPHL